MNDTLKFPLGIAYIDGDYRAMSEAKISVLDWGFLRSDATYDVVHVWQRRFFRLNKHLVRFSNSVARLHMTLPFDRDGLTDVLMECVRRSGLDDAYVEMICTRGVSPTFSRDPRDAVNTFIAFAIPFGWVSNEEQRAHGLNLSISDIPRIPPQCRPELRHGRRTAPMAHHLERRQAALGSITKFSRQERHKTVGSKSPRRRSKSTYMRDRPDRAFLRPIDRVANSKLHLARPQLPRPV